MQYTGFPMPAHWGNYLSHAQMTEYLEAFAEQFALRQHIRFRTTVTAARISESLGWEVARTSPTDGQVEHYDALIVASGHDWDPNWPDLPGAFTGRLLHTDD